MSLWKELQREGFEAQLDVSGEDLTHVATSESFRGILEPQIDVDPSMGLLGADIRECDILHVLRTDCPPIAINDLITDAEALTNDDGTPPDPSAPPDPANPAATTPTVWKVVKRSDDPSDVIVKFTLIKKTDKDS